MDDQEDVLSLLSLKTSAEDVELKKPKCCSYERRLSNADSQIVVNLPKAIVFSVLDASSKFWRIILNEESRKLTTCNILFQRVSIQPIAFWNFQFFQVVFMITKFPGWNKKWTRSWYKGGGSKLGTIEIVDSWTKHVKRTFSCTRRSANLRVTKCPKSVIC